jgi:ABC-type uncharacterized transport system substrate-binding protein
VSSDKWKETEKNMKRKIIVLTLTAMVFVLCVSAEAQQPTKVPRISYLTGTNLSATGRPEAFRQGLRELGYVDGKNIVIEWRSADGTRDRQRALAAELVRLNVDVIVTGGSSSTRFAKEATVTIPIVMTQDDDPVGRGVIASLARPGGNITGLSSLAPELSGKRLELLTGASKGGGPWAHPSRCLRNVDKRGPTTVVERDRARRRGVAREASIHRRAGR